VQDECHRYTKRHGPVKDGDAITSEPGQLPCKMIIHAVGPVWHGGQQGEGFALRDAVRWKAVSVNTRNENLNTKDALKSQ
jgi:O-acetyl-ADP-ribose deacetylase (regulator of RNase III)